MEINIIEVNGWQSAIRGMRLSWNSDCDSYYDDEMDTFFIGENDKALMRKLSKAGTSHRKFMRTIHVTLAIRAPLYWWKQLDAYKIGCTSLSESTMHTLMKRHVDKSDFVVKPEKEYEDYLNIAMTYINLMIDKYRATKDTAYFDAAVAILPSSYMQTRILDINYETLASIYKDRKSHKLVEWRAFCRAVKTGLYMSDLFTGEVTDD